MYSTIILASLAATLIWVVVDSLSKFYIKKLGINLSVFLVALIGIVPMLLLYAIVPESVALSWSLLAVSLLAGAALFIGYTLVYRSVSTEGVANSYVLIEIQPILLILFGVLVLAESLNTLQILSMIIIFIGISMIVTTQELKVNKKLIPSLAGNIIWSMYWAFIIVAVLYYSNFILPLLLARIFSAVLAAAYYFAYSNKNKKSNYVHINMRSVSLAIISLVVLAGLFDGIGNLLFSFISFSNKVVIGSAILSMEPIIIWLIGFLVYKEKITRLQGAGFFIATIGYIAFSLA
jgi:drug/metabolite transporter (DMT)-like permease